MKTKPRVSVAIAERALYPSSSPFHPHEAYPEFPFGRDALSSEPNFAYAALRDALALYGADEENYGTPRWNPLKGIVCPGDQVVIKPNFVLSFNEEGYGLEPVVTHPSILRAVADYAFIALEGKGSVRIVDAPQWDCDFDVLGKWGGFEALRSFYTSRGLDFDILDVRRLRLRKTNRGYITAKDRIYLDGDPLGYAVVNLGEHSLLNSLPHVERLYGSDYDRTETVSHHSHGVHEYLVSKTILGADVVLNVPKMKVHKKVGVTLNVKNLVGINGDKNYLPHYRIGSPSQGGDEFPDSMGKATAGHIQNARTWLQSKLLTKKSPLGEMIYGAIFNSYRFLRDALGLRIEKPILAGNWYANDTCWRMAVDLMTILFFADTEGILREAPQRRFFSVVDGLIGGQRNGPLAPKPIESRLVVAGDHPYAVDIAVTRLMGFDWQKIPQLTHLMSSETSNPFARFFQIEDVQEIEIRSPRKDIETMMFHRDLVNPPFEPHPGWVGHIEL